MEDDTSSIREQGRVFPFCSSGTPADDNCYRKCDPDAGCQEWIQKSSAHMWPNEFVTLLIESVTKSKILLIESVENRLDIKNIFLVILSFLGKKSSFIIFNRELQKFYCSYRKSHDFFSSKVLHFKYIALQWFIIFGILFLNKDKL